jgi:hypothetical protein
VASSLNEGVLKMNKLRKSQKGQAIVELALLLPILLIIMAVVFQISLMIDGTEKAQMATWYAIRAHSEGTDESDIEDKIKEDFFGGSDDVEVEFSEPSYTWVDVVKVINEIMGARQTKVEITYSPPLVIGNSTLIPMNDIFNGIVEDDKTPVSASNHMLENSHR